VREFTSRVMLEAREIGARIGVPIEQTPEDRHQITRKLGAFRTYQKQPAHRARAAADQLRGFLTNWKVELAGPLVEALDSARVPRPLDGVLGASGWRPPIRAR